MAISNVARWEDFTGGYWVGNRDTAQAPNTWTGDNIWIDGNDGCLMPMQPVVRGMGDAADAAIVYGNIPPDTTYFTYPVRFDTANGSQSGDMSWAQESSGTTWDWYSFIPNFQVYKGSATFTVDTIGRLVNAVPALGKVAGTPCAFLPNDSTHITRISSVGTVTTTVVGAIGNRIARWEARMISWVKETTGGVGTNILYFSNAADYLTWPTTNFYEVGDDQAIQTVVVTPGSLLIGKRSGWWELQGTLGSTASIRQLSTSSGPPAEHAHQVSQGQVIYDGYGQRVTALALQGLYPRPLNGKVSKIALNMARVAMSGLLVGYTNVSLPDPAADEFGWIYDAVPQRWARYTLPASILTDPDDSTVLRWAWDFDGNVPVSGDPSVPTLGIMFNTADTQIRVVAFHGGLRTDGDDGDECGRDVTATVTLVDHQSPPGSRERAVNLWVEVQTPAAVVSGTMATCSIRLQAKGIDGAPDDQSQPFTAPYLWERHSSQLEAATRYMIRFEVSELGPATAFAPEITLKNLKLRRVLLGLTREQIGPV